MANYLIWHQRTGIHRISVSFVPAGSALIQYVTEHLAVRNIPTTFSDVLDFLWELENFIAMEVRQI